MWGPTLGPHDRGMNHHTLQQPMSPAQLAGLTSLERSQRAAWRAANLPDRYRRQTWQLTVVRLREALTGRLRHPFRTPKTTQPAW